MTTVTLSITESNLFTTLGNFLVSILPANTPVLKAQTNRVAEPPNTNFVLMTPLMRNKLGLNWTQFNDGYPTGASLQTNLNPTNAVIQIDVHGPAAADNAQIITTLFWSGYACDIFQASGFDITPLYNSDPRQLPYLNGEQQIETRWSIDLNLQVNAVVSVPQQFASALNVKLISVEATYHP